MGLSNYVPNSRISQAGVVDNTADRPASPYEGQLVYQRDTNQLLVWDGSAWVMIADTDQPPGLQLIKTQTFTSEASVNIENVFSSEFRNYRILMNVFNTGSVLRSLRLRWRTGTTNAQGNDYYPKGWYNFGTLTGYSPAAQNHAYIADCFNNQQYPCHVAIDVFDPNQANRTVIIGQAVESFNIYTYNFNNVHAVGSAYTGFNLELDANSLSGTVRVYGYRD